MWKEGYYDNKEMSILKNGNFYKFCRAGEKKAKAVAVPVSPQEEKGGIRKAGATIPFFPPERGRKNRIKRDTG